MSNKRRKVVKPRRSIPLHEQLVFCKEKLRKLELKKSKNEIQNLDKVKELKNTEIKLNKFQDEKMIIEKKIYELTKVRSTLKTATHVHNREVKRIEKMKTSFGLRVKDLEYNTGEGLKGFHKKVPDDCIIYIYTYLNPSDVYNSMLVFKTTTGLLSSSEILWEEMAKRYENDVGKDRITMLHNHLVVKNKAYKDVRGGELGCSHWKNVVMHINDKYSSISKKMSINKKCLFSEDMEYRKNFVRNKIIEKIESNNTVLFKPNIESTYNFMRSRNVSNSAYDNNQIIVPTGYKRLNSGDAIANIIELFSMQNMSGKVKNYIWSNLIVCTDYYQKLASDLGNLRGLKMRKHNVSQSRINQIIDNERIAKYKEDFKNGIKNGSNGYMKWKYEMIQKEKKSREEKNKPKKKKNKPKKRRRKKKLKKWKPKSFLSKYLE